MKKTIYFLTFLILISSVFGANNIWMGGNNANTNNANNPQVSGASLSNIWTSYNITSCTMNYQPLVYDFNNDNLNDIVVFCSGKIKIYDYTGTLKAELITGALMGSPRVALKENLNYYFVAILNYTGSNDINLSYYDFNGTNIILNKTFSAESKGNGTAVFCGIADTDCYAINEGVLQMSISSTDYFCNLHSNLIECYSNPDLTGTVGLNITTGYSCPDTSKIMIANFNGGDDEVLYTCGNLGPNTETLAYFDSTGTELWHKTIPTMSFFYSYIDNDNAYFCSHSVGNDGGLRLKTFCYDHSGTLQTSQNIDFNYYDQSGDNGILYNIVQADYNNDGIKEIYSPGGVYNIVNSSQLFYYDPNIKTTEVLDLNLDGSLDYLITSGTKISMYINGYTNTAPTITQLSYNTGNPICLGSSITYTVYFEDDEGDFARARVDAYGNGNYTSYGFLSGFPYVTVTYNQLGTYTSIIEIQDESGNNANITHGVIVQSGNCYTSGQSGGTSSESTAGQTTDIGGFIITDGTTDGYQRNNEIYNSNNSIYFDASQCVELYGDNWERMIIPCPLRLLVKSGLEEIKLWIYGSFILIMIVLIIYVAYIMNKK